ncbi:hypothetical protein GMMP1_1420018 [Candidatus Magnetomoraceae bacterium gMMP-1]
MRLGQKVSTAINKTNKAFHALVETIVKIEQLVGEIVEANNDALAKSRFFQICIL